MMSFSPDPIGHSSEPMTMGTPTSPSSPVGHQSQYLPSYLLGDSSMSHAVSPVSSRLWSGSGGSPPRSCPRPGTFTSPNSSGLQQFSTPRIDTSMRGKDKAGAPPIRSLLQSTSPGQSAINSPFSTPSQFPQSRNSGLSTPAPPTIGLTGRQDSMFSPDSSSYGTPRIPTSPAQLDPFYTQGEALTPDDVLDETWVTVFGFPPPAVSFVLQQFSQYGNILKHVVSSEGNWMHIHYQSKIQAKKALSKNGKVIGNNIMVGVSHCIDKLVMRSEKENEELTMNHSVFGTPNSSLVGPATPGQARGTPIRPLTAAYKAARSEHEVLQNNQAARKNSGFVSKAMEYMFGW